MDVFFSHRELDLQLVKIYDLGHSCPLGDDLAVFHIPEGSDPVYRGIKPGLFELIFSQGQGCSGLFHVCAGYIRSSFSVIEFAVSYRIDFMKVFYPFIVALGFCQGRFCLLLVLTSARR